MAAEKGLIIAAEIGDDFVCRQLRWILTWAQLLRGDVRGAADQLRAVVEEFVAAHDAIFAVSASVQRAFTLAYLGDLANARALAEAALQRANDLLDIQRGLAYSAFGTVHLAAGDATAAWEAYEAARERTAIDPMTSGIYTWAALAPLACGDLAAAARWADDVVSSNKGWGLAAALTSRARVKVARAELDAAEGDAYDALDLAARVKGDFLIPFALDCLAIVAAAVGNHLPAARLFGAAQSARQHMGLVPFKVLHDEDEARRAAVRDALGQDEFDAAWAEGAALSIDEAIAYAQRGRGERKRASTGWASLTRAELDVVKLVSEGLGNKDVAARLFVSPRTVQAHLTHVYTKLGLTSRVQLAQEAARHS